VLCKTDLNKTGRKDLGGNKHSIRTDGSFEKVRFEKNNKTVFFHNHTPNSKPKKHDVTIMLMPPRGGGS
jgi:hypothetical protein